MGYSTDFTGQFKVTPTLKPEHAGYLATFSETRRMERDAKLAEKLHDPIREDVGLPVGTEGAYYVGDEGNSFGGHPSILDNNNPPKGQPGLWCNWIPTESGEAIEWNGGEKFYEYTKWLVYLIKHFLAPWGYVLNGNVEWQGEGSDDNGVIYVKDNKVEAVPNEIKNPGPSWMK